MKKFVVLFLVFGLTLTSLGGFPLSLAQTTEVSPVLTLSNDIDYVGQYKIPVRLEDDMNRDQLEIGVMFNDMANDFYVATLDAIKERASQRNVKLYVSTSNNSAGEEPGLMENYLNMGVDGVITVFYASEGSADVMQKFKDQGIPSVNYIHETRVFDYQLTSNNTQDGIDYANAVINWVNTSDWSEKHLADKETIKIAVGGLTLLESMGDRTRAIIDTFEKNLPNGEVVAIAEDIISSAIAYEWAETAIVQNPDIDLWIGFCDVAALGIYEALLSSGRTGDDCKVFGMDGTPDAINAMKKDDGLFEATLAVDAHENGYALLDAVIALNTGLENELFGSYGNHNYYKIFWLDRYNLK
ncbi:MAG: sugar ABC transporter substrate-binding protein [Clostridiales bacterium]|nr:sugar ABC transporter substrate-binding protein [Clostridiales bacterium]